MGTMNKVVLAIGSLVLTSLAAGCDPGPFNVSVFLDDKDAGLRDKIGAVKSIEVDFIGVNESELERWKQMSINGYWEPDNAIRAGAKKHVMTFGQTTLEKQVLLKKDQIWRTWIKDRGAEYLVVIAYLPWIQKDQPGEADPRRVILPLKMSKWEWSAWGEDTIPIQVGSGGMTLLRPYKK
jgi:hypothetical protein